jgi:hypothetical protein
MNQELRNRSQCHALEDCRRNLWGQGSLGQVQ